MAKSDPYSLTVTAPAGIVAGHSYWVKVYVGSSPGTVPATILGRSAAGTDHFGIGAPWGRDYIYQNGPNYNGTVDNSDHHVYNVTSDPFLKLHAKGDGVNDDEPAIEAAIVAAQFHGGGLVYLPAGTYWLGSPTNSALLMHPGVVLQGQSNSNTIIKMGPTTQQPSSYFWWESPGPPTRRCRDLPT